MPYTNLHSLSSPQLEIWFGQKLHADQPLYNIGGYVEIYSPIDAILFEQAVNLLVQKHDALRIVLTPEKDGITQQNFVESLTVELPILDFSDQADPQAAAMAWMQARFIEPFELINQPLFRFDLIKLAENQWYCLAQYHHLITDDCGLALFNRSLGEIYTQLVEGQNPDLTSPSYADFICQDRVYLESPDFKQSRQFWLERYSVAPDPQLFPHYRQGINSIGSGVEVLSITRDFYCQLEGLAKKHQSSLFGVLLGALYVYFTRSGQRDDFAVGIPMFNRPNEPCKNTAGLFGDITPAHFDFGKDLNFTELLGRINKTLEENHHHQRFPIGQINRAVGLEPSQSNLFDVRLCYENHDHSAKFGSVDGHYTNLLNHFEQTPLTLLVRDADSQTDVKIDFVYNHAYFNGADIKALQTRFKTILQQIIAQPQTPLWQMPIMPTYEGEQLQAWNQTQTDFATPTSSHTIIDLFEQQVEQNPNHIAVVFDGTEQKLSFAELNHKANQLAHYLT
ncbi:MAG: condensation domain-containing protein, partial [Psychrosphaera sp.]|nr:condensation domain-containing protein [Psychrosphaera sp.]